MLTHAEYLRVELAGVRSALNETLRHRFNSEYHEFYTECDKRLRWLERLIKQYDASPLDVAENVSGGLEEISDLITRMERSHLEEFAWPFANCLRSLALAICYDHEFAVQEQGDEAKPPIFFFTAEGGMASYSVVTEVNLFPKGDYIEIFPVIFPRSLKDHVLLHVVLSHEIGHVAYRAQPRAEKFREIAADLLNSIGLGTPDQLKAWCAANMSIANDLPEDLLEGRHGLWAEEFFCDLFGLITMGPSFIPALLALLGPTNGDAHDFIPSHPPLEARMVLLAYAAEALGMEYSKHPDPRHKLTIATPLESAFVDRSKVARATAAGKLIDKTAAMDATKRIHAICSQVDNVVFQHPDSIEVSHLVHLLGNNLPPSAPEFRYEPNKVPHELKVIDFRHILYAGWLSWSQPGQERSHERLQWISKLCLKAILHQQGIEYWIRNRDTVPGL